MTCLTAAAVVNEFQVICEMIVSFKPEWFFCLEIVLRHTYAEVLRRCERLSVCVATYRLCFSLFPSNNINSKVAYLVTAATTTRSSCFPSHFIGQKSSFGQSYFLIWESPASRNTNPVSLISFLFQFNV